MKKMLLIVLIFLLSSCSIGTRVNLQNGKYYAELKYQHANLSSWYDLEFEIKNYHVYMEDKDMGKFVYANINPEHWNNKDFVGSQNLGIEQVNRVIYDISKIKTGMKLEKDIKPSDYGLGIANLYLIRYKGDVYFIPVYWNYNSNDKSISRIYLVTK